MRPTPKPTKKPKKNLTKRYANDAFSMYIRVRDAILTTGTIESFRCISCGKIVPVVGNDCGHFIGGRKGSVLFHEQVANGQCAKCNRFLEGNYVRYEAGMREKYGFKHTEGLKLLKNQTLKHSDDEFKEIKVTYRKKLKLLIKRWEGGEFEVPTSAI